MVSFWKKGTVFSLFLCLTCSLAAQPDSTLQRYSAEHGDSLIRSSYAVDYDREAREAVDLIVRYTGLKSNFKVISSGVSTAVAYIKNQKRYIAYNPLFIARVKDRTRTDWGAVSVLAHEIGHHLLGHTLKKWNGNITDELDADKFSGFILCRMGASLEEAKATLLLVDLKESPYHPNKTQRLDAIAKGWLEAKKLDDLLFDTDSAYKAIISVPADSSSVTDSTDKKYVYKCLFYGDRNYFFVDDKNQVISIDNTGKPFVIGYKVKAHDRSFDWSYSSGKELYGVDSRGKIWKKTTTGEMFIVGRVFNIK